MTLVNLILEVDLDTDEITKIHGSIPMREFLVRGMLQRAGEKISDFIAEQKAVKVQTVPAEVLNRLNGKIKPA